MATTGRTAAADSDVDALAATLREADFVHFVSHADGDSIAAAGLLARALPSSVPYQVSVARSRTAADRRIASTSGTTVSIGLTTDDADDHLVTDANAAAAFEVATDLGDADPMLAVAGALAAGTVPQGPAYDAATDAGLARRPGVAIPTADLADGLAHSCLFHARFSGQEQQAGAFLAELDLPADLDDTAHRAIASAVSLAATEPPAPSSAASAIEHAVHPHVLPDGPFETAEGYADVLDGLARSDPGLATALALGRFDRAEVLDRWRTHATDVHDALRLGDRARHSGLVVLEVTDGDVWTTARLARDFRSAEPRVLVVDDDEVALATTDEDAVDRLGSAVDADSVGGRARLASARTDGETDDLVAAIREDL